MKIVGTEWIDEAACQKYPDIDWHSEGKEETSIAKDICLSECQVTTQCLQFALISGDNYGVWGGFKPEERKSLRRRFDSEERIDAGRTDDEQQP